MCLLQLGYRCPSLKSPGNGRVSIQWRTASYSCDAYYTLVGQARILCYYGKWYGQAPKCVAGK